MLLLVFFLISFSEFEIPWSFHTIEPTIFTVYLEKSKNFQVFLLNKFEKILFSGQLSLLVWSFSDIECSELKNIEELLISFDKSEKVRFSFTEDKAFSKTNISAEESQAHIKINVQLKTRGVLELVFGYKKSEFKSTACLVRYTYKSGNELIDQNISEKEPEDLDQIFAFIEELEKKEEEKIEKQKRKQKNYLIIKIFVFFSLFLGILFVISCVFGYEPPSLQKKENSPTILHGHFFEIISNE